MKIYFLGSIILIILGVICLLAWFSHRAGRNSANIQTQKFRNDGAVAKSRALQRALEARTNGIRNIEQLIRYLDEGIF